MIYIRISPEQWSKFRVDDPCNFCVWMRCTKRCNCGQRMNDVSQGAQLDDQDRFRTQSGCPITAPSAVRTPSSSEKPIHLNKKNVGRSPRRRLNVLLSPTRFSSYNPIFQSPVARQAAAADLLQRSSFARLPDHILRETAAPDYFPYRKCRTLRASFHHAVGQHCPC